MPLIICNAEYAKHIKSIPLQDLGWANGWPNHGDLPEIVAKCMAGMKAGEKHDYREVPGPFSNTHIVTCYTCGYTYQYDSGD